MLTPVVAAGAALRAHDGARALVLAPNDVSDELAESATTVGPDGATTHVVLGDLRGALSYGLLDAAFGALMRGAHLWALQRGRYFLAGGEPHVDTGAVVAGLEYAAGVTAHVLGKPSASFARLALSGVAGIAADRTWVVGDDATSDIAMGLAAGLRTVLVRTGKGTRQADAARQLPAETVLDSIADLPGLLQSV